MPPLIHRPRPECFPCIVDVTHRALEKTGSSEETKFNVMRQSVDILAKELDRGANLPAVSTKIFRLISERTGNPDPFLEEKRLCNQISIPLSQEALSKILAIEDEVERIRRAALVSIAGNTMDLGTSGHSFDLGNFQEEYEGIIDQGLAIDDSEKLADILSTARSVLYLGDNAGEIAFDRVLVAAIHTISPRVTFAVKGGPISNDATLADAEEVSMFDYAKVITTGTDHLGISLDESSDEFLSEFESSDVIIAKGQSNLETILYEAGRIRKLVAFVLRAKCRPIARVLGVEVGDNVLKVVDMSKQA